jgi:hypothetical protein
MTRPQRWDVRIAPDVEEQVRALARRSGDSMNDARRISVAQDRLAYGGTRASGVKKIRSLDLWEIRAGRHRLFFCLVPGTNQLAVGALFEKTSRRIEMARLRQIEREVHRWRDALGRDR